MTKSMVSAKVSRFLLQQKYYFDKGLGVTGYFKYIVLAVGVTFKDPKSTILFGFAYAIFLYFVGLFWTKKKLVEIENDIANQYNPFVKDTLKLLNKDNKIKRKV